MAGHFDASTECIFGEERGFSRLIDSSHLQCITPPRPGIPRLTAFSLGSRLHHMTFVNDITFRYHVPCHLNAVSPRIGPEGGGAVVQLTGVDFVLGGSAAAVAQFGTVTVPCATADSRTVECIAPQHAAATVPLQLSFNGGHDMCIAGSSGAPLYTFMRTTAGVQRSYKRVCMYGRITGLTDGCRLAILQVRSTPFLVQRPVVRVFQWMVRTLVMLR